MLNQLRKGVGTWVAKIFIGVLILSFAVWGVEGLIQNNYSNSTIASVGDVEITATDYERLYPTVINEWNQRLQQRLTPQQIKAFQIPNQVKTRLINQAVVDNHVDQLALGISDTEIGEAIKQDPQLRDGTGQFSRELLRQILRSQRISEQSYFDEQRTTSLRAQITSVFTQKKPIPDILMKSMYHYREDKTKARYFIVPKDAYKKADEPSAAEIKDFYETTKLSHEAPEYRKAALYVLSLNDLMKKQTVSDEDLQALYKARKQRFVTPATRTYDQLVFETMEKALEAHKALKNGDKFEEVAKKFAKDEKASSVGPITKPAMTDAKLSKAIFDLKKDEFTAPIEGTFAITIAKVTDAREREEKSLDDVKADLTKVLQERAALKEVKAVYDKIEDYRASGMSIEEVAKELGEKAQIIDAIDEKSAGLDGKAVPNLPQTNKLTAAIFDADIGDDTVPVRHLDKGYVWFDVLKITPKRIKAFDEVKDEVKKQLLDKNNKQLQSNYVDELVKKIKSGEETFGKAAKTLKAKISKPDAFGRGATVDQLPVYFVNQLFGVKKGQVSSSLSGNNKDWVIAIVDEQIPAKTDGPAYDAYKTKLINELQSEMTNDFIAQYLDGAKSYFGVEENKAAFDAIVSGRGSANRGSY